MRVKYSYRKKSTYVWYTLLALVLLTILGVMLYVGNMIVLRINWHDAKLEINKGFDSGYKSGATMEYQGQELAMSQADLNYYYRFIFSTAITAIGRSSCDPDESSLVLHFPKGDLTFTSMDDGLTIHIHWQSEDEDLTYELSGNGAKYKYLVTRFTNALGQSDP